MDANPRTIMLVADRLCLNFVNTVDSFTNTPPKEYLRSYADLLGWGERVELLDAPTATMLLAEAVRRPAEAVVALERAKTMRWSLYQLFSALAHAEAPPAHELRILNQTLHNAPPRTQIALAHGTFVWAQEDTKLGLDHMLWSVAWSAADLLTSHDRASVRECEGMGCTWMFRDTSRGRTRRWCSMEWCGNRAKAQRYYRRVKGDRS
jgi:predicted RNA-binding Zn ribbon-like protein